MCEDSIMATNIISIYELIRILERDINILRTESHSSDIDLKFRDKLERFGKISCNLTDKLQSILHLSENYNSISNDLKQFVNGITSLWTSANKQVYEKCSKIRMASRTLAGVPLSLLLKKIKKERSLTRELLNIHENEYSHEHVAKCYTLLSEIEDLLSNLEKCDDKLQYYLGISKLIPFLIKLESTVDVYASTIYIEISPQSEYTELDVFPIVAKLLTGELLAYEPINPYHVLADNALRKPVFIIKTRRRMDISSAVEMV